MAATTEYRGPITTALQFCAASREVEVIGTGAFKNWCWMSVFINDDGTEKQHFFLMERYLNGVLELRVVQNLSSVELHHATWGDLTTVWNHPRAHTPQR